MRIRDLLSVERILPDLGHCHVADAITAACRPFTSVHPELAPQMVQSVLARWWLVPPVQGHVGYAEEVAPSWPVRTAALARSFGGIEHSAKDGNRVHVLIVSLGPRDIFTTGRFSGLLRQPAVYDAVMTAESAEDILCALDTADQRYPEDDIAYLRATLVDARRPSS